MRAIGPRLRLPLTCVAFGSVFLAYLGIHLMTPGAHPVRLTGAELVSISLPLTVAWFSFSATCMLTREEGGVIGILASWSRFAGQACLFAGIPVWAYWYLSLGGVI